METNQCDGCKMAFFNKYNLAIHVKTCKELMILKYSDEINQLKLENKKLIDLFKIKKESNQEHIKQIKIDNDKNMKNLKIEYENYISELKKENKDQLCNLIQTIAKEVINRNFKEAVIELENDSTKKEEIKDEYELQPLNVGNDLYIESRDDGYINITNLCKSCGKKFSVWNSMDKTKFFLKMLSEEIVTPIECLVIEEPEAIWVHPYVAINIAQWISPNFDVKISSWIYEVMLTGKIDISKTKSFQQLRLENKEQQLKIKYLTKRYVKSQPRIQYTDKNVIYILTTPPHKKEGKYILGKATNLTNRLSTYNKTDEHEVVYYQACPDEETMSMIEQFVFQKLKMYREQANRERFILPEGETVELFIDVIKKSIDFLR